LLPSALHIGAAEAITALWPVRCLTLKGRSSNGLGTTTVQWDLLLHTEKMSHASRLEC